MAANPQTVAPAVKPPNKALLLQLDGLIRQKGVAEASLAKLEKDIAALQAKRAASGLTPAETQRLQAAIVQRAKVQDLLVELARKISDVRKAMT